MWRCSFLRFDPAPSRSFLSSPTSPSVVFLAHRCRGLLRFFFVAVPPGAFGFSSRGLSSFVASSSSSTFTVGFPPDLSPFCCERSYQFAPDVLSVPFFPLDFARRFGHFSLALLCQPRLGPPAPFTRFTSSPFWLPFSKTCRCRI